MGEPVGLTGEQVNRLVLFRELEQLLDAGFSGQIILHCGVGEVFKYEVSEMRKPGEQRSTLERRIAGPRQSDEQRKG